MQLNAVLLARLLRELAHEIDLIAPGPPVAASPPLFITSKETKMGQITVKDSDPAFTGTVTFLDAKGSPTEPDDVPTWTSDDETVVTVEASEDGKSATLTPGSPGTANAASAQVTVSSTDTDGTIVTAVGVVTVTAGEAVVGDVEFATA